ncbi:isochorismatase family protein [Hydrogenophaga sp. BPS33]|uniref:isochorismatase family protein n=1 Tax=Hydrogenophaga sp. BPS33 TaxID=2651974 RepID=UPI00131FCDED|nr:isochorismatase family protein [Hydrogenophaga sp. BPS33]QHE83649.1 isochorismatase family protein [Hydrogenophaga sp. BPS33]
MSCELRPSDLLLVIDVQNDFVTGSVAIPDAPAIVPVINRLVPRFEQTAFTLDWHPRRHVSFASSHEGARAGDVVQVPYGPQALYADHCVQGTWGAELDSALDLSGAVLRLHKGCRRDVDSFSAFTENDQITTTGLAALLHERQVRRIFFAGLSLYGCVRHSALHARKAGFDAFIVTDACRARPSPQNEAFARELADQGVGFLDAAVIL